MNDKLEHVVDYEAITRRSAPSSRAATSISPKRSPNTSPEPAFEDARVHSARVRVEKLHALPGAESGGVEIERCTCATVGRGISTDVESTRHPPAG